jgi:uncharacterized iron-regulated protein
MEKIMKTLLVIAGLALAIFSANAQESSEGFTYGCIPAGHWVNAEVENVSLDDIIPEGKGILLAGETHTHMPTHLWQYYLVVEAFNRNPDMVIAMESFPRSVQPVLDKWVAGDFGDDLEQFATESRWSEVWGYDIALYEPILQFARQNSIPIRGMNVDKALIHSIRANGWSGTPEDLREGLSVPEVPVDDYIQYLADLYNMHGYKNNPDAPTLQNFILSQQIWDKSFATTIAEAYHEGKLVVAIVGQGHVWYGWGIVHQLKAMSIDDAKTLMPWHMNNPCEYLNNEVVDFFYGL